MIRVPRWAVGVLAMLLGLFDASLGIVSLEDYADPIPVLAAIIIFLAALIPTIALYPGDRMPQVQALFNVAVSGIVPMLVIGQTDPIHLDKYSTWFIAAIALLMGITAVRQHAAIAWVGTGILSVQLFFWAGIAATFRGGLPGALMLVGAAHAISIGIQRASKEVASFTSEALSLGFEREATTAARSERQKLIEQALHGAMPMLRKISDQQGSLTDSEKIEARLLEASLRDEIRGRGLLNDKIRIAARSARLRGVEVLILDEGGLAKTDDVERDRILNLVASKFDSVKEGRLTLRSPEGESWKVTLVASRPGVTKPDLWEKF